MNIMVFDRSDQSSLDHAKKMLDAAAGRPFVVRTDVVLMNDTNSGREYTLHVADRGFAGDLWLLDVLSRPDYRRLMEIANRMRANAKRLPEGKVYVQDRKYA